MDIYYRQTNKYPEFIIYIIPGGYNAGKPGESGKLGEFVNIGKFRENSGEFFNFTRGK